MAEKKMRDPQSESAMQMVETEMQKERLERAEREKKEKLIAKTYQMLGQIRAANLINDFAQVSSLVWLKEIKESKIYKGLPGIGSWESFCNRLGKSRAQIDKDLLILNTLTEEFLLTVSRFNLGYRELNKLRYAAQEGDIVIENKTLKIGHDEIPLDTDHQEDVKAAIETLLEKNETLEGEKKQLKKKQAAIIEEETKALKTEREALIKENQRLKVFDPAAQDDKDIAECVEQMKKIYDACTALSAECQKFFIHDQINERDEERHQVHCYIEWAKKLMKDLDERWLYYFAPDED